MATKKKVKPYIVAHLDRLANNAKDIDSFLLYSRDGEIQGVITNLPCSGETIIHLTEDHNPRISLETLEKWAKQARRYDRQKRRVVKAADKASSILASAKKSRPATKKTTKSIKKTLASSATQKIANGIRKLQKELIAEQSGKSGKSKPVKKTTQSAKKKTAQPAKKKTTQSAKKK